MDKTIKEKIKFLPIKIIDQKALIQNSSIESMEGFLKENKIKFELQKNNIIIPLKNITQKLLRKIIEQVRQNRDNKLQNTIYRYYL